MKRFEWKFNASANEWRLKTDLFTVTVWPEGRLWRAHVSNAGCYVALCSVDGLPDAEAAKAAGLAGARRVLQDYLHVVIHGLSNAASGPA